MKYILITIVMSVLAGVVFAAQNASVAYASKNGNPHEIIRVEPYNCGTDMCPGYRCVGEYQLTNGGISVSPACYNQSELTRKNCRNGSVVYVPDFNISCQSGNYYYVWTSR